MWPPTTVPEGTCLNSTEVPASVIIVISWDVVDPLYTIPFAFFLLFSLCLPKYSIKRRVLNSTGLMISTLFLLYTPIRQMKLNH